MTLQALDPIFVDFYVPQQSVDQMQLGQPIAVKVDAFKDQTFTGEISAINPKVDAGNRNVQIRATLKNPDHKLLPGMYATVDIADRRAAKLRHAAADRDHLQSVRRYGLHRRQQGQRTPTASRNWSRGRRFVTTGADARRSGRRPQGRQ